MSNSQEIDRIIAQYRQTVGLLDSMFTVARVRTNKEIWRDNGFGSCVLKKQDSEGGLIGPAKEQLITLREEKNRQYGGTSTIAPCPYHRENYGCVLKDLKSPCCIAHFDADWDWRRRFRIDAISLNEEIWTILSATLNGEALGDPSGVKRFNKKVTLLTKQIAKHPLFNESLHPAARFNRFRYHCAEERS